jgi:hypothetical protein
MLKIATSITFKMKALPEPNSMLVNTLANPSASAIVLAAAAKRVSKMSCFMRDDAQCVMLLFPGLINKFGANEPRPRHQCDMEGHFEIPQKRQR